MSGNHGEIAKWRREQSEEKTKRNRPDLLERRDPTQ
jgi:tRNA (guanine37-N1)-methyltransferase